MNDKALQMLEQLAGEMGTTVEYLWGVLISQAAVSATVDIVLWALLAVWLFVFYRFVLWASPKIAASFPDDPATGIPLGVGITLGAIASIGCFGELVLSLRMTITALVNPEYWALHQVLEAVR